MATPRNRKERRAAAKDTQSANNIPMSQPDRTKPKGRTLYDLAAEKEAELTGRRRATRPANSTEADEEPSVVTLNPDGTISGPDGEVLPDHMTTQIKASMKDGKPGSSSAPQTEGAERTEADDAPFPESILYTVTLSALYFTLTVLVMNQYGMTRDIHWNTVIWQTISNAPFLLIIVYFLHPRAGSTWVQWLFLVMSIGCGMWMVTAAYEYGYMAVMRKAPGAGTIWVWAVLENRLEMACLGLAIVAGYWWYGDYSLLA